MKIHYKFSLRKAVFLLTMILLFMVTAKAQITITISDFPHAGMLVVRDIDSTTQVLPGSAGINQVWDFSNLVTSYTDSTLYLMPAGLPGSENYPTANLAEKMMSYDSYEDSYSYSFYESTTGGWKSLGEEMKISFWGMSFCWHMFLEPPISELPLPFTYNDEYNNETLFNTYKSTWFGGVQSDTSLVRWHLAFNMKADGSGTIITPTGSFDALRVKRHFQGPDSTFIYDPGQGWVFQEVHQNDFYTYTWYANGIGEVGSIIDDGSKGGSSFSFFKSSTIVGEQELKNNKGFRIYPSPAHDYLQIEDAGPSGKIEVFTNSGNAIWSGNCTNRLDISSLSPGLYFVRICSARGVFTEKFIKE